MRERVGWIEKGSDFDSDDAFDDGGKNDYGTEEEEKDAEED
jgi:hypothetical protein